MKYELFEIYIYEEKNIVVQLNIFTFNYKI